ncbi:MAG TPA: protein translocase subunit SecF [Patescibacteria group bacterium]
MVTMMEKKKIWLWISALLLIPGIVSLFVWKLQLGIDFKGGSLSEYQTTSLEQGREQVEKIFTEEKVGEIQLQSDVKTSDDIRLYVKSQTLSEDTHRNIVRRLEETNPVVKELSFETIDPQVGRDVTRKALMAIIVASAAIILYLAYSFRGVPKPVSSWQFGVIAVIALLHDVLFIIGFYSLMGHFAGYEVRAEFVTAALTVMGFSVHDTIVVFDRLRENLKRHPSNTFSQIANMSVAQTMTRSLNTSLTVILVLLAIVLLGGESIREFTLTLLVGIAVGTYSSIFVATPLLDWWQTAGPKVRGFFQRSGNALYLRIKDYQLPSLRRQSARKTQKA